MDKIIVYSKSHTRKNTKQNEEAMTWAKAPQKFETSSVLMYNAMKVPVAETYRWDKDLKTLLFSAFEFTRITLCTV